MESAHRPGPFKQNNKAHKSGKKKWSREMANGRQRVRTTSIGSIRSIGSKKGSAVARGVRKNQLAQIRKSKREELLNARRGISVAPLLISVLNMRSDDNDLRHDLLDRLQSLDPSSSCFTSKRGQHLHIELPKFHANFQIVLLDNRDLFSALDLAKISDILLLLHSPEIVDDVSPESGSRNDAFYILDAIYHQCLPQTIHGIIGLDQITNAKQKDRVRKSIIELIEKQYPGMVDGGNSAKLRSLDTAAGLMQLFHYCSNVKRKPNNYCSRRSQLLAEEIKFEPNGDDPAMGTLIVDGFVRNSPFNVNSLVYIPEFGEFQLQSVETMSSPFTARSHHRFERFCEIADPELRPSLNERENPIETLYEQEMADLGDGDHTGDNMDSHKLSLGAPAKSSVEKKKVPKGTSEYQAAWIIESDDDDDDDEEEEDEDENDEGIEANSDDAKMEISNIAAINGGKKSVQFAAVDQVFDQFDDDFRSGTAVVEGTEEIEDGDDDQQPMIINYDDTINLEEDRQTMAKFKQQRAYEMFPDEIDTPTNISARDRFCKFRGLKSFRTSTWDAKENLPPDYSRISQFENFNRTKRRLLKCDAIGADIGRYIRVNVINVSRALAESFQNQARKPLILFQLLAHEHKMSVQNIVLKKCSTFDQPIQSKDELIFHLGCRRFAARPIFSTHSVGDKHKFERYLRADVACVATIYAPITFPPAPVLVYRRSENEDRLAATGSLLDCSPDRVVIKRYILSGHPFKINRRHAVVRYMFFDREDILWFRPVELRTKYGRRGHIVEPLGTHGHMKCVFDRQLTSQDTVLMCLYKRVFPKWSYRELEPSARSESEEDNIMES